MNSSPQAFRDDQLRHYLEDTPPFDDMHTHFEGFGRWDWCDVYREGLRVLNIWGMDIEDGSPTADVIAAVAAQSAYGAMAAVAAALDVPLDALRGAVAEWYESPDELPQPVGADGLMRKISEYQEWLDSLTKANENGSSPVES